MVNSRRTYLYTEEALPERMFLWTRGLDLLLLLNGNRFHGLSRSRRMKGGSWPSGHCRRGKRLLGGIDGIVGASAFLNRGRYRGNSAIQADTLLLPVQDDGLRSKLGNEPAKQALQILIIGLVLEAQATDVGQVPGKLIRKPSAEVIDGDPLFAVSDFLVLLLVRVGLDALPWEGASEEVKEDMSEGLQVIPPALLPALVCVDGHVPGGPAQALLLTIRDVLPGHLVDVILCHPKVHNVNGPVISGPHKEIVRLDVPVDHSLVVDRLNPADHLDSHQADGPDGELAAALVKDLLETRAQQLHHQAIKATLLAKVVDRRDSRYQ